MKPIKWLILASLLAATACEATSPLGDGMDARVAVLRAALEAHPETPEAVGEAGTDLVIFWEGAQ